MSSAISCHRTLIGPFKVSSLFSKKWLHDPPPRPLPCFGWIEQPFKLSSRCLTRVFCHSYAVNELSPLGGFCLAPLICSVRTNAFLMLQESQEVKQMRLAWLHLVVRKMHVSFVTRHSEPWHPSPIYLSTTDVEAEVICYLSVLTERAGCQYISLT